ncbi:MAG: hypothetical protein R6U52_05605 [Kosmotogaceae bacterium]
MTLYYNFKNFLLSKIKSGFLCHFPLLPFLNLRFNCQTQEKIIPGGEVPNPIDLPSGCPFHPRCSEAREICKKEFPDSIRVNDTRNVSCHLFKNA